MNTIENIFRKNRQKNLNFKYNKFDISIFLKKLKKDPAVWLKIVTSKKDLQSELKKHFIVTNNDILEAQKTIQAYLDDTVFSELHGGDPDAQHNTLPSSVEAGSRLYRTSGGSFKNKFSSITSSHVTIKSGAIIDSEEEEENGRTKVKIKQKFLNLSKVVPSEYEKEGELFIGWIETSKLKHMKKIIDDIGKNVGNIKNGNANINRIKTEKAIQILIKELLPLPSQLKKIIPSNSLIVKGINKGIAKGVNKGIDKTIDKTIKHLDSSSKQLEKALAVIGKNGNSLLDQKIADLTQDYLKMAVQTMISIVPIFGKGYLISKEIYDELSTIKDKMIKALDMYQENLKSINLEEYEEHRTPLTEDLIRELQKTLQQKLSTTNKLLGQLTAIELPNWEEEVIEDLKNFRET